ncbi:restriction endonuclease subunit M [Deinococcus aerolatus]|uniref:site-specific DNA-methyltransferase (adenine-specific) n=1 Tax=Deinococcus aerolatus TaxID=522487 RepID=A0ABQ2GGL1_9DEIO|nr:DNA adenine methylase [Deinococcus aerolatus]GGL95080.1 restriction endonuclease subunit M [Deinococcus aerolatus]
MTTITQPSLFSMEIEEDPRFLERQIITYIGNKRSLLPFIGKGINQVRQELNKDKIRFLDLFSGSGIVSRYAKQFSSHIISNDLEMYSYVTNSCYLTNISDVDIDYLSDLAGKLDYQIQDNLESGFITKLYAPKDESQITEDDRVFYTRRNAMYLDTACRVINELPKDIQHFFLAPLMAGASIHTNTSGVFKGFYKSKNGIGQYGGDAKNALTRIKGEIKITSPILSRFESEFTVYQKDVNVIVDDIDEVDIAYLDPPYNQHPYGSNYFMLNLLCSYQQPDEISRVSGIPIDWNRSRYNQRKEAESALFDLVDRCRAKYVLISYNSEGFIKYDSFIEELQKHGSVTALEMPYNTFRGSRNLKDRNIHVTEFLFLLKRI